VSSELLVTARRYLRARDAYLAILEAALRSDGGGIVDRQLIDAKAREEGYLAEIRGLVDPLDDPDTYHPGE